MTAKLAPALIATLFLTLTTHAQTAPPPGIPAVVAKARPAVVNIVTRQVSYDGFLKPVPAQGIGSGVIFDARGYVLTNAHVVEGAQQMRVTLPDGRTFSGKLVGADPVTDVAVVKIEGSNFPVATLGDSGKLEVGETVIAIGNPLGLEGGPTVTVGVVSAIGRSIEDPGGAALHDLVQTDAAINPGNSGGALINSRGELVGINTGIYSESGGYQGIGFAVPSNLAKKVVDDLMKFGEVRRGSIGYVGIEKLTPQLAEEVGAPNTGGALVSRMTRDSEVYDAGLRPGDVIITFNGQSVTDPSHLNRLVLDAKIGSQATVVALRDGRRMEFKLPIVSTSSRARR